MTNVSGPMPGHRSPGTAAGHPGRTASVSTACGQYSGSAPSERRTCSPNRDIAIGTPCPSRSTVTSPSPSGLQSTGNQWATLICASSFAVFSSPNGSARVTVQSALKYSWFRMIVSLPAESRAQGRTVMPFPFDRASAERVGRGDHHVMPGSGDARDEQGCLLTVSRGGGRALLCQTILIHTPPLPCCCAAPAAAMTTRWAAVISAALNGSAPARTRPGVFADDGLVGAVLHGKRG